MKITNNFTQAVNHYSTMGFSPLIIKNLQALIETNNNDLSGKLVVCDFELNLQNNPEDLLTVVSYCPVLVCIYPDPKISSTQEFCLSLEERFPDHIFRILGNSVFGPQPVWVSIVKAKPWALVLSGPSFSGKSSLARSLRSYQTVHADDEIMNLLHEKNPKWSRLRQASLEGINGENIASATAEIHRRKMLGELMQFILRNFDIGKNLVIDMYTTVEIRIEVSRLLQELGFFVHIIQSEQGPENESRRQEL
jgi:hypothetical protein